VRVVNFPETSLTGWMNLVSDEQAWLAVGTEPLCFDLEDQKMRVMICRDQSHPTLAADLAPVGPVDLHLLCPLLPLQRPS